MKLNLHAVLKLRKRERKKKVLPLEYRKWFVTETDE